jgi:hypothetical protein
LLKELAGFLDSLKASHHTEGTPAALAQLASSLRERLRATAPDADSDDESVASPARRPRINSPLREFPQRDAHEPPDAVMAEEEAASAEPGQVPPTGSTERA